jgi:hypothetical protein
MTIDPRPVILVLAGGRATRMGGDDKALRPVRRDDLARPRPGAPGGAGGLNANGNPACWLGWNGC